MTTVNRPPRAEITRKEQVSNTTRPFCIRGNRFIGINAQILRTVNDRVHQDQLHPVQRNYPSEFPYSTKYVTVLTVEAESVITAQDALNAIVRYASDDAFMEDFLEVVLLTAQNSQRLELAADLPSAFEIYGTKWIGILEDYPFKNLQPGAYTISEGEYYEIWRLYDDSQRAFVHAVAPCGTRTYTDLQIGGPNPGTLAVAVPFRKRGSGGRLNGWRIAVKDNFSLAGIQMTLCNKSYYELYPAREGTAKCLEILRSESAVIVGTTKLASFAATEEPIECIDYEAPWNPRGDGYQSPAGSSSGSGAAIASYDWLDIAIGSDTSGSGRRPGHWNGCFAMRPTHNSLSLEGFVPSFTQFDTPTYFGRDLAQCKFFASVWYGDKLHAEEDHLPPAIVYPTDYMKAISSDAQSKVIGSFVRDLESSLGVSRENISFEELWDSEPPTEARGETFEEYMRDASRHSFWYDDYHSLSEFRTDYKKKFSKTPYISPPVRWQWGLAADITKTKRDDAVERLDVYKRWFISHVMRPSERHTIIVIPIEEISPRYRDEPSKRPFYPVGVPMLFLSPVLGAPELTVPIGELPYESKVSGRTEYLPIGISLLSDPGRDLWLFDVVEQCLNHSRRPAVVSTGRRLFSAGE